MEEPRATKKMLLDAIRANCLDCGGGRKQVRDCGITACSLWPYRMGEGRQRDKEAAAYKQLSIYDI